VEKPNPREKSSGVTVAVVHDPTKNISTAKCN